MSPKKEISTDISENEKLSYLLYSDFWKISKHSLGAELDLVILLAEPPEHWTNVNRKQRQSLGREI